jgi:hypothetical protein
MSLTRHAASHEFLTESLMTPPALIWNLVLKPQGIQLRFFLFFPTDLWGGSWELCLQATFT